MAKEINLKDIKKDIQSIAQIFIDELTTKAMQDMEDTYKSIIDEFYDEYKPRHYHRKKSFYKGLYYSHISSPNRFSSRNVVIAISDQAIPDHNPRDKGFAFYEFWERGIRGLPHYGENPLGHSFKYTIRNNGNEYLINWGKKGKPWENPYWDESIYKNRFRPSVGDGNNKTPHIAMYRLVNEWGSRGGELCDAISNTI